MYSVFLKLTKIVDNAYTYTVYVGLGGVPLFRGLFIRLLRLTFVLQFAWFFLFFTNILGFIGSYNLVLQNAIWLSIPLIGLVMAILGFFLRIYAPLCLTIAVCSGVILTSWLAISGITLM